MRRLTVLHINKFHYLRGGSEAVYFAIADLLSSHGHNSIFFSMAHPLNISCETEEYFVPFVNFDIKQNFINEVKLVKRVLYYSKAKKNLSQLLDKYPVDIAHLHNIHHQISPSILHTLKKRKIPIVMTLHDYKMVCASYNMLVQERPCEICVRGRHYKAILHKCLKDSYRKSALAAAEMYLHHKFFDIYSNVDAFISPSMFHKEKLEEMGFNKKISYLMNFIDIQKLSEAASQEVEHRIADEDASIIYFGRLTQGKGLFTLFEAISFLRQKRRRDKKFVLKIIGEGPLKNQLEDIVTRESMDNVEFLGYLHGDQLYQEIRKCLAVVLASEWYENNPMCIMEAFTLGKPVIGSNIAGIPELVRNYETGLTFEPENPKDLSSKIEYILDNPNKAAEMGENARVFVEQELNPEKYYQRLIKIYKQVLTRE